MSSDTERTLLFDFLAIDLGAIRGFKTRFHLYSVPGQVYHDATRRLILKGVDGVVFVADSQADRQEANLHAGENLLENLARQGAEPFRLPCVIQYNKRDVSDALPVGELQNLLNPRRVPHFEGVARRGHGVFETLSAVSRLVLLSHRVA